MKKRIIAAVVFVVVALLGFLVFDSVCPKAEKVSVPDKTQVTSVKLGSDSWAEFQLIPDEYDKLFALMGSIKPTRKQSVNDYPYVTPYYTVTISTSEQEYRCFVYSEDSSVYVEFPYQGIYESNDQLIDFILSNRE